MFGRVRASSIPAESLERPPCKIFKDDSLSIYEVTLMKLKLGSKRNLSPCSNEVVEMDAGSNSSSLESEPMNIEVNCASSGTSSSPDSVASFPQEEVMTLDTDCSSERSSVSSSGCDSAGTLKQPRSTEVSVLYLFSKFKRAHDAISSSSSEAMIVDSVGVSPSSSGSRSVNNTEQQSEQECISSFPATEIDML
ncbi:PREDICTED: uncharacterized protein LOC101303872 [Fragaria vesca subsp. vesca]|uniref:uncharacterized protein LOC101303872 n=1 Tax=Fragaria vesca subsp. vesca TaxID=101020 RepID=UPI0002C32868|nr:PREDICTED: uncharacterized protein LOC101303872 [Fragaria vesca subsp. vesca]